MTINNEYNTTILSSYTIYNELDNLKNINSLAPILFNEVRKNSSRVYVPDYLFKNVQYGVFNNADNFRELLNNSLDSLIKYLYIKENIVYVREDSFHNWQSIIKKVSPLIILAYFLYKNEISSEVINQFKYSVLPSIYNKHLNKVINDNEIVDIHIHLNGTTEADIVWQDILKYPKLFLKEVSSSFDNDNVNEQYLLLDAPMDIESMTNNVYNIIKIKDNLIEKFNIKHEFTLEDELSFFITIFKKINLNKQCCDTLNLWKYMLKYNFIYQLLVQQDQQVGFDQFEKITINELREYTEKEYSKRYDQIQSIYKDNISLEGRFAPKNSTEKMLILLDNMLKNDNKNLTLVAHFIKKYDNREIDNNFAYRDMPLRIELEQNSKILTSLIKNNSIYKKYINGFDAAGNELNARPETFAPIFKYLRNENLGEFTFHGGEDFIDIISGIRYIYEIVEFLEFDHGDRIGHATAIGIDPELWKNRIGEEITISQGEYLDNLIFVYYIIRENNKHLKILNLLKDVIQYTCFKIYKEHINLNILIEAWKMRKEDPKIVLNWTEQNCIIYENIYSNEAIRIFKKYHTDEQTLKAYKKMISINTNFFKNKLLVSIQNILINILNKKNIIIETMISSNVTISFYNSYDEHHIKRWLGIGKSKNFPKPILTIATDDPGIFATNMRNELSHLYLILKKANVDNKIIFNIMHELLENNRIYKF